MTLENPMFSFSFINNPEESVYETNVLSPSTFFSRVVVRESGILERMTWMEKNHEWVSILSLPRVQCENYAHCGANGNCETHNFGQFECECLPGFTPKLPKDWSLRNASGGCVRKNQELICRNREGFLKVANVIIPDTSAAYVNMSLNLKECGTECLRNCSCTAYANAEVTGGGSGCLMWTGDLLDTRKFPDWGQDLYIRVDRLELGNSPYIHFL